MANTTIDELTPLVGASVASTDKYIIYDTSAGADKSLTHADLKSAIGSGTFVVTTTGVDDALIVTSTDSGASAAPDVVLFRNSATPAPLDQIGGIVYRGKNSSAANVNYATIGSTIVNITSGLENSDIQFATVNNGELLARTRIKPDGGIAFNTTVNSIRAIDNRSTISGSSSAFSVYSSVNVDPSVNGTAVVYSSAVSTSNTGASFNNIMHYRAGEESIGVADTVQSQYGLYVQSTIKSARSNYGVYIQDLGAAAAGAGKSVYGIFSAHAASNNGASTWNFYASGSAPNYMQGKLGIGGAGAQGSTHALHVIGSTFSSSSIISGGQIAGSYNLLSNGATAVALGTNSVAKVTPTANATYTTTVAPAGARASLIIVSSGTTSYTITFGTNFKTSGTIATGSVSGKTFVISFVSDGTSMIETGRTTAI